jgi:hypothetical protein
MSTWVWQHSEASGNDLLLLLALADIADDTGKCWPSVAHLAEKTRLSRATVQRRLHAMTEEGRLRTEDRRGTSNVYYLRLDREDPQVPQSEASKGSQSEAPNPSQSVGGSQIEAASPTDTGGASPGATGGASPGATRTINEPPTTRKSRPTTDTDAAFDVFWKLYPKKVGRDAARTKWTAALKRASLDEVMAGLHKYLPIWRTTEPKFIPNPATWLNQGRWQDELRPTGTTGAPPQDQWLYR